MEEIDLVLVKGDTVSRIFESVFDDGSPQSLVGYTVVMWVYKTPEVQLNGTIGGTNSNEITIIFGSTVNSDIGLFEYEMIATPTGAGDPILLGRGNIAFNSNTGFTTQIQTIIEKEALGIPYNQDWITQSILYWKLYLQPGFELSDSQIADDSNWPPLVRFLIGKLVVYDYINHLAQVNIASSFGTTTGGEIIAGSGALKKLTTGPSSAEWFDTSDSLSKLTQKSANGSSAYEMMGAGICALAARVGVWLPMCPVINVVVTPLMGPDRTRRWYRWSTETRLNCISCGPDRG